VRTGFSREELLRLRLADLSAGTPPYSAEDGRRWVERAKSEGSARFEWLRRNKDGSLHWDEVRLRSARIGGSRALLVFAREITESKLREQELRASEEQYRTVFNASADALVLWNSRSEPSTSIRPMSGCMATVAQRCWPACGQASCPRSTSGCRQTSSNARSQATAIVARSRRCGAAASAFRSRCAPFPSGIAASRTCWR